MGDTDFTLRVAVVSGAARGIGFETARQLLALGHKVALIDIDAVCLDAAAKSLDEFKDRIFPVQCDITILEEVKSAVDKIAKALGRIEILVNCAGWGVNRVFLEMDDEEIERIVNINFTSVLVLTRAVLPDMTNGGWGRIVNISSDAARVGTPREATYSGAKAAVVAFSKALCAEVARHGVTVNVVCPGTTDTPLLHAVLTPEQIERRAAANPSRRLGQPGDVAAAVLFFTSEAAGFVNGQVLSVSGGITRVG